MNLVDVVYDFLFAWAAGYLVLTLIVQPLLRRRFEAAVAPAKELLDKIEKGDLIPLKVEQHQNTFLCYHSLTNDYVCQGKDLEEIVTTFKLRYPDKSASLYEGEPAVLEVLRTQLKMRHENSNSV